MTALAERRSAPDVALSATGSSAIPGIPLRGLLFLFVLLAAAGSALDAAPALAHRAQAIRAANEASGLTQRFDEYRGALQARGLNLGITYTGEVFSNLSGGLQRDTYVLDNFDGTLLLDLERLLGWRGASAWIYVLGNQGGNPSESVGDAQGVSNIETPAAWRWYEAWVEQSLAGDRATLRLGLYDLNSEFDVIPSAQLFTHSSHGIGADFGLSGRNGPSIFPVTSLGLRVALRLAARFSVRGVVADGVPGDPNDLRSSTLMLRSDDGVLWAVEAAWKTYRVRNDAPPNESAVAGSDALLTMKLAWGIWGFTTDVADRAETQPSGAPLMRDGSLGSYVLAERSLYAEPTDATQGLRLFGRAGVADARTNPVDAYLGGGLVYQGPLPTRGADAVGLGVAAARAGSHQRRALQRGGIAMTPWEVALEATYQLQIFDTLSLRHALQYIVNPGFDRDVDDALALSLRVAISLP